MTTGSLLIRADASIAIATGHVMRCLALAQAWQDVGGEAIFAMAQSTPAVEERLRSDEVAIAPLTAPPGSPQDAAQLAELAQSHQAAWVVVDGYQFDAEYQRSLKQAGLKLLVVDDQGHAQHYFADLVINQNVHASQTLYPSRELYTRLLLGPHYAMLRREFEPWRRWQREIAPLARKVLVTMGGSDPDNLTLRVIEGLQRLRIKGLEATVVAGGSNPHAEVLARAVASSPAIRVVKNATHMPELMMWADVAVSAAGSTCWEMCLLSLPAILIDLAENQRPIAEELDRQSVAVHLGSSEDVFPEEVAAKLEWLLKSPDARTAMSQRARALVDGRGADRVVFAIRCGNLRLRQAEEKDCRMLWEWANDPAVRAASFSSGQISWEQHVNWFESKLSDSGAVLYIATDQDGIPVGQVRYQVDGVRATLSINLGAEFRGKGYGSELLSLATAELFQSGRATAIDAYVKPDNQASLCLFTCAGFQRREVGSIRGQPAVHFVLHKPGSCHD